VRIANRAYLDEMIGNRFLPLKQHWNKNEEELQAFFNFFFSKIKNQMIYC